MKKSQTRHSSPDSDSEVPFAHPGTLLQQIVEYVLQNKRVLEIRRGIPSNAGDAPVRPSGYSDDLGTAVMVLMAENRQTGVQREITDIVSFCERKGALSGVVLDYLDNKILNYGHYLTRGDEHACLMYFAKICELVVAFSSSTEGCLATRVVHEAKQNMFMYSDLYESYIHVDAYAKLFLSERNSAPNAR